MQFSTTSTTQPAPAALREQALHHPRIGTVFTDHMVTIQWTAENGWHDARVRPREPFSLDPASAVLHYGQEIFEGMKAYGQPDGSVALFRPEENARRFNASASRMSMPTIPESVFVDAIEQLLRMDGAWVPKGAGTSLYLRPFMFATESFLGVRPATQFTFCVIASPAGAYFKGGAKPIAVWVSERYTRAARGGTGAAKCGGNYAAGLTAQAEAIRNDCDQVVFLDAAEGRWIEELGGMNVFFVVDGVLVTPSLGTILPGITRDSIIGLAKRRGVRVEEKPYSFDEWREDAATGRLTEAFACGTAAVIAAIGKVRFDGGEFTIPAGPLTDALRDELVGIQRGVVADELNWTWRVK
ncbi:Branched-chain-amino-acid aminotransferase [Paraburkholderia tropica]|uniref:branched-chain amino acid aminotransferase n=1 Tax=Paraburkholderia tropica TaxID=92647 RepID=UPI001CB00955|nr:branched-chain amino acid aminotransferase [Paraburkholderia tropica]CAG9208819.1 Branched-chain-amino-acid aminotransferase [Paraburkholderia tropica]